MSIDDLSGTLRDISIKVSLVKLRWTQPWNYSVKMSG